jgi:hypothetical protein
LTDVAGVTNVILGEAKEAEIGDDTHDIGRPIGSPVGNPIGSPALPVRYVRPLVSQDTFPT